MRRMSFDVFLPRRCRAPVRLRTRTSTPTLPLLAPAVFRDAYVGHLVNDVRYYTRGDVSRRQAARQRHARSFYGEDAVNYARISVSATAAASAVSKPATRRDTTRAGVRAPSFVSDSENTPHSLAACSTFASLCVSNGRTNRQLTIEPSSAIYVRFHKQPRSSLLYDGRRSKPEDALGGNQAHCARRVCSPCRRADSFRLVRS
jgi:hypothetical protein